MPTVNRWRGDAQGRAQVDRIVITDPEVGDVFTITCNRKDITATAEDPAVSGYSSIATQLYIDFAAQFGPSAASSPAEFQEMTAGVEYPNSDTTLPATGLLITGDANGKPFTLSVSSSDVGDLGIQIDEVVKGVSAVNEQQTITLEPDVNGGTFTLTYDGQTTGNIAWNANAATVQTALEGLSNIAVGDVSVSGTGPWVVTFQGAFAGADVDLMTADGTLLTVSGAYTINVTTLVQGNAGLNENQVINIGNPTSGTFTLTFAGQTTAGIAYNASAAAIQTALEALSNIAPGDLTVTALSNQNGVRFRVTFKGTYRNTDVPQLTGNGSGLDGWQAVSVVTSTQGRATQYARYRFTVDENFLGTQNGTFAIRLVDQRVDYETTVFGPLAMSTLAATINSVVGEVYDEDGGHLRSTDPGCLFLVDQSEDLTEATFELRGEFAGAPAAGEDLEVFVVPPDTVQPIDPSGWSFGQWQHATIPEVLQYGDSNGVDEVQRVSLLHGPTGGTFTLTFQGSTTAGIAYNADAATVQAALEALGNIAPGDVTVSGSAGGPWTCTFGGTYASTDLQQMTGAHAGLTGNEIIVSTTQQATPYTNEKQRVSIVGGPAGGTFTLSWGGFTTAGIAYNASAATVEAAIEAAFSIGVTVTGNAAGPWTVEFSGATVLGANQAQMTGSGASLTGSQPNVATTREAVQPVNEQQTVTLLGGPGSGTFTLTYSGQTTAAINYNASSAQVRNALVALSNIATGEVDVTGDPGGPWTVEFTNGLGATDVVLMTGDGSGLSPGLGTQTISIESVTTPTGPEWITDAENWSLGTLLADNQWGVFEDSDRDCLYGLDQMSTVTPAKLIFKGSYTGQVGLPDDNGSYVEYRPKKLRIGTAADAIAMTIEIGEGLGEGPSRLRLDTGDCQTTIEAHSLSAPENGEPVALDWVGTHASNIVRLYKCQARLAGLEGELATIATLVIAFVDAADSDVSLILGDGLTLGTVTILGGSTTCRSALAGTTSMLGGNFYLEGAASAASLAVRGGTFFYSASGTLGGNTILSGDGVLDFSLDQRTKTVTNPIDVYGDTADVNDPYKVANAAGDFIIDYNETTRAPQLGRNYRIVRRAVA